MGESAIDIFELCRRAGREEGTFFAHDMPRLAARAFDAKVALKWSLQGSINRYAHLVMTMQVTGQITLICQRCMQPFDFLIDASQVLVLAKNDAQADEIELLLDDDTTDVIVVSHQTKVIDLIEDEALLALPFSPRHERCASQDFLLHQEEMDTPPRSSPFDILKGWKQ